MALRRRDVRALRQQSEEWRWSAPLVLDGEGEPPFCPLCGAMDDEQCKAFGAECVKDGKWRDTDN